MNAHLRRNAFATALMAGATAIAQPAFAGITYNSLTKTVTIAGGSTADVASVQASRSGIQATLNGASQTYSTLSVREIRFYGSSGDDQFTNLTSIRSVIDGGTGNDTLDGGSGNDEIIGNLGNDIIRGNAGNDRLLGSGDNDEMYGGLGDDTVLGHGGNDQLHGGDGRDLLNGGSGDDLLWGDAGQDQLVSMGLGVDLLWGGSQWDSIWRDSNDFHHDPTTDEIKKGYLHVADGFHAVTGARTYFTGFDAVGEELMDPAPRPQHTDAVAIDFSSGPLFGPAGPVKEDVLQQLGVNDCYFMSRLSAMSTEDPEFIRNSIAPLGDGSYAVRFYRNGKAHYVRVDGDLWTRDGRPIYANIPASGATWVAFMEKAYAVAADDLVDYESIDLGQPDDSLLVDKGATYTIPDTFPTPAQVRQWDAAMQPNDAIGIAVRDGVKQLFEWIQARQALNIPLIAGSMGNLDNNTSTPNSNNYRRGQHIYMVDSVELDGAGQPVRMVLYNPDGSREDLTDLAVIWYLVGRATELKRFRVGPAG